MESSSQTQLREMASSVLEPQETVPGLLLSMNESQGKGRLCSWRFVAPKMPIMRTTVARNVVMNVVKIVRRCFFPSLDRFGDAARSSVFSER